MRKPEALGTEFKTIVDSFSGILIWLEVQAVEQRMSNLPHTKELNGTVACVLRGVEAIQHHQYDDNESLRTNDYDVPREKKPLLCSVWVSKARPSYLFEHLEWTLTMSIRFLRRDNERFSRWIWIALKGHVEKNGVDLVCIGYNYNKLQKKLVLQRLVSHTRLVF